MSYKLIHGDCFEEMAKLESGSFDLILTDPPYGTMKGAKLDGWEGNKTDWDDSLNPIDIFNSCARLLRVNGKLLLFSQEPYTSELVNKQINDLPFCYKAIWIKNVPANILMSKSAMVSYYEEILIFQKSHDTGLLNPLRGYFRKVLDFIGAQSCKVINKELGDRSAEHCFYVGKIKVKKEFGGDIDHCSRIGSSQFCLCTEGTYERLISVFGIDKMEGFKPYLELKKINRQNESRFNLWEGKDSKSNVLYYPKDSDGSHPTQKPVSLLEDLIKTFSDEGDKVLDFTMGSGSTGVACRNCNRDFVGIERDDGYFRIAQDRLNGINLKGQTSIFTDFSLLERKDG
jgi:site-specific DNA-methyltransferase (adenine-specific)